MKKYKNYLINKNSSPKKRKLLALLLLLVLLGVGVFGYLQLRPDTSKQQANTPETNPAINLSPPTAQDKAEADQHKDDLAKQNGSPVTTTNGLKNVTPVITGHAATDGTNQAYAVGAFIAGIYENNGACTLTATLNSKIVTKQVAGEKDATTTTCYFDLKRSDFPSSGTWNIKVGYVSNTASGTSETTTLEVK